MKLTSKIKVDKEYYDLLDTMSIISSNLSNELNYRIRMNYFNHIIFKLVNQH